MRRPSLTPRRNSLRPSMLSSINLSANSTTKRRDTTQVRNKQYQSECFEKLYNFLIEVNFEDLKIIKKDFILSSKTFNKIFEILIFYLQNNLDSEFASSGIELDVIEFMRWLEYPYLSELNRSQLKSITPHSWPVLLSMLAWLTDLVYQSNSAQNVFSDEKAKDSNFKEVFNKMVIEKYLRFMEGEDDIDDTDLKTKLEDELKIFSEKLAGEKKISEELSKEIQKFKITERNELIKKTSFLKSEIEKTINTNSKLPKKIIATINSQKEIELEMKTINIENLKKVRDELQQEFKNQSKKIETYKINNERYKNLKDKLTAIEENLRSLRVKKQIKKNEKNDLNEEIEKIYYEIKNLIEINVQNVSLEKILKEIEETLKTGIKKMTENETEKFLLKEKLEEIKTEIQKVDGENIYLNKNLLSLGEVYLDKKNKSDISFEKSLKELQTYKHNILQNSEYMDHNILQLEQLLRKSEIEYETVTEKIKSETAMIETKFNSFFNQMRILGGKVREVDDCLLKMLKKY